MPLEILLPMVIVGIAGITLLLHLLGLSRPAMLADEAAAQLAWLDEFPGATPRRITLSHDHSAALVDTAEGAGIVWSMGADTTARHLNGARITRTSRGLRIDLPDYTAPRIHLSLTPAEANAWAPLLEQTT